MTGMKVLRRNKIALFLAAMLIFCAFGADNVLACSKAQEVYGYSKITVLEYPEAGEFFANSLPEGERQSVRETSADWQSVIVFKSGRYAGSRSGPKGADISILEPDGLQGLYFCAEKPGECIGVRISQHMEVIVCYIHNQDGQKG